MNLAVEDYMTYFHDIVGGRAALPKVGRGYLTVEPAHFSLKVVVLVDTSVE
jgi:hypothetical protein